MKVTEFNVSRKGWLHGEGPSASFLLRQSDGKMCCLGFFCVAAGCSPGEFANIQVPNELDGECRHVIAEQLLRNNGNDGHPNVVNDIMTVNDRKIGVPIYELHVETEERRESMLAELFAKMGVKVNFVD